jgi:ribosomal protein S27E
LVDLAEAGPRWRFRRNNGGEKMVRGPHGHEKTGVEVLRVLCPKCNNRVSIDPGEDKAKCAKCGTVVKRPSRPR